MSYRLFFHCGFVALIIVLAGIIDVTNSSDCDCGPNSIDCKINQTDDQVSVKKCICKEGYAPLRKGTDESCEKCDCGEFSISCSFGKRGDKDCECAKGYGVELDTDDKKCEVCDCGSNAQVCYILPEGKLCKCKFGDNYEHTFITQTDEKCKECECGPKGVSCGFNRGNKFCKCEEGFSSEKVSEDNDDEYCKPCDCGEHGKCIVNNEGNRSKKECICDSFYAERDGKCEKCDCGFGALNCSYIHLYDSSQRKCACKEGYAMKKSDIWYEEYCEKCDCGEYGLSCEFLMGYRKCTCQDGYVANDHNGDFMNDYCTRSYFVTWILPIIIVAGIFTLIFFAVIAFIIVRVFVLPKKRNYQARNNG